MNTPKIIMRASFICLSMMILFSCASYHQQSVEFYSNLERGNYEKASKQLDQNKLLGKQRNKLLYLLEKGRVEHLLQHFEKSNQYLNEADHLMEASQKWMKDLAMGTLLNPMMQNYYGEDFEKYMIHYYKALNYLFLNKTEDALVEARRISLRSYAQERSNDNKYSKDAFSFMLQGMIYEKAGDINNAFIAYRNAADIYLKNGEIFYGTRMPDQLKRDVLRTAYQNGFTGELTRYEELFVIKFDEKEINESELIIFWENGLAPVKTEQNLFFSLSKDGSGNFFFVDAGGGYHIPFDQSIHYNSDQMSVAGAHSFRATLPQYRPQSLWYHDAMVTVDSIAVVLEPAQNINELAIATLHERRIKDLSKTLSRLAVKKLAEEAAKPDEDEKDPKKKHGMEALSIGLKLFSMASEKADTRNWQSLPHSIFYSRIPLKKGSNHITIEFRSKSGESKTFPLLIENRGGLYFYNICTLDRGSKD